MPDLLINYTYNPDTGNLASNAGVSYTYSNNAHKHAVTGTSDGRSYGYDQNGNQTTRTVGGITYTLIYDAENRLVQIKRGTDIQATYSYDGDSNRVKTVVGSTTTTYIGSHLEWSGSTTMMKKNAPLCATSCIIIVPDDRLWNGWLGVALGMLIKGDCYATMV